MLLLNSPDVLQQCFYQRLSFWVWAMYHTFMETTLTMAYLTWDLFDHKFLSVAPFGKKTRALLDIIPVCAALLGLNQNLCKSQIIWVSGNKNLRWWLNWIWIETFIIVMLKSLLCNNVYISSKVVKAAVLCAVYCVFSLQEPHFSVSVWLSCVLQGVMAGPRYIKWDYKTLHWISQQTFTRQQIT